MKEKVIFSAAGAIVALVVIFILLNIYAANMRSYLSDNKRAGKKFPPLFGIPTFFGLIELLPYRKSVDIELTEFRI